MNETLFIKTLLFHKSLYLNLLKKSSGMVIVSLEVKFLSRLIAAQAETAKARELLNFVMQCKMKKCT